MTTSAASASLRATLLREASEMVRYAFASGLAVPAATVETVERYEHAAPGDAPDLAPLVAAHARLAKLVAPATPGAIVLLADAGPPRRWGFLGPVPLVRRMTATALVCVAVFILISLSKSVTHTSGDIFESNGIGLLANEVFWLAAAGIGASFSLLFQVNQYIVTSTYDPRHEPSYWVKLILGVMAGFILVALVPLEGRLQESTADLARPTLAMLGGYSASAVYRILNRLVEMVESLFRGDAKEMAAQQAQAAAQRAEGDAAQARLAVAGKLVELQRAVAAGSSADEVTARLREIVAALVPEAAPDPVPALAAPSAPAALPPAGGTAATEPALVVAAG